MRLTLEEAMEHCLEGIRIEQAKYIKVLTDRAMFNPKWPGIVSIVEGMQAHAEEYIKFKTIARDLEELGERK